MAKRTSLERMADIGRLSSIDVDPESMSVALKLLSDPTEKAISKHEKKLRRKKKLDKLVEELEKQQQQEKTKKKSMCKGESTLSRLLRIAELMDGDCFEIFARQFDLYASRQMERLAHFVPSKDERTPPMWRRNMDYDPEERSP